MRKLLLTLTLLCAPAAWAQNGFFYNIDPPAPNANLRVCLLPGPGPAPNPCTTPASLFSDVGLTVPAANPVTLGPSGNYGFWVAAGQYVIQLSGTVSRTIVVTLGGGAGGAGTLPRLDQVLNPNTSKLFDLGTTTLSFSDGVMDLSALTSPLVLPSIGACTTTVGGQICFDSTNKNYLGFNTSLQVFATFPTSVTAGDIAGFANVAGALTLQDLGSPSTGGITPGNTFITANITNIREGDSICFDVTSGSFVNCTEGVPVTVISAATYTVNCATDRGAYLLFTSASAIAVTLPQATTGSNTCDASFFTFMRTLSADLTVTPTTSTINDGGGAGATLVIHPGYGTSIFSDNTNYFAKVGPFREGTNPLLSTEGYDVGAAGRYQWQEANGSPATALNKMVCLSAGVAIICPSASSTTNNPDGSATNGVVAAPGSTGNTGVCSFGFCPVFFDNSATSGHYAQLSSTVDGDLHDVGTTVPTNGQAFWHVWTSNSGANTTGVVRILTGDELNAAAINGGGKTTVTVNGTKTQPQANFVDTGCTTWTSTSSGNTSTIGPHVCHGLVFNIGDPGNSSALTVASTTTSYLRVPFACTIKDYSLMIDAGTITVKFWKVATGTAIPTSGNSISTSGVSISSGTAIRSATVSDFTTTAVAANDFMAMNVTAVATAKFVNGVLSCQE